MTAAGKLATENAVGRHFRRSQKCKSLHPFDPGTEALEAPWYHPDSARMARLQSDALRLARHVGNAESITLVSRIQARRRVQQGYGLACTTRQLSLKNVLVAD